MAYQIDGRRVAGVVVEANKALDGKDFNHGEVVIGLAELMGRVIVDIATSQIQAQELVNAATEHLVRTINIGAEKNEKRIITGV